MRSAQLDLLGVALVFVALTLACDIPFSLQERRATFVEDTEPQGTDPNATPAPPADASTTPGAFNPLVTQPTRRPATTTPRVPPGVYTLSIRVDPPNPRSGPNPVVFHVRFQNAFTEKRTYRWFIKIFRPGEVKSFGETAAISSDIAVGLSEIPSAANWRTNPIQCEDFIARVFWWEQGNAEPVEFKRTDGVNTTFVGFRVCP